MKHIYTFRCLFPISGVASAEKYRGEAKAQRMFLEGVRPLEALRGGSQTLTLDELEVLINKLKFDQELSQLTELLRCVLAGPVVSWADKLLGKQQPWGDTWVSKRGVSVGEVHAVG